MSAAATDTAVRGIRLGVARAAVRRPDRDDVLVIECCAGTTCAGTWTRNAFRAAPVQVAEEHVARGGVRALLVNSGNANAGTGAAGVEAALTTCRALALELGVATESVLPFSTGVIGEPLPVERIVAALPEAVGALHADGWQRAAGAIMTTDTVPKLASRTLVDDTGSSLRVTGIAKGAGMIRPDMATMLAFIATDAAVERGVLHDLLRLAVDESFNRITVDGDTSTNDACVLLATGAAGGGPLAPGSSCWPAFARAVREVVRELALAIVRDAEGATKFIELEVTGGRDAEECLAVAWTIAHSPLVKTACFASDPNWGRLLAAIGRAGLEALDTARVSLTINGTRIATHGMRDPGYTESAGQAAMAPRELRVQVDLGRGAARECVWTCDLSHDYVRINADYRS